MNTLQFVYVYNANADDYDERTRSDTASHNGLALASISYDFT